MSDLGRQGTEKSGFYMLLWSAVRAFSSSNLFINSFAIVGRGSHYNNGLVM